MRTLAGICLALPLLTGTAFGWGCEGHQMIALIARAHLTPAASAAVDQLLRENPIDPAQKRYCQNRPADPLSDTASWADDMKSVDKTFTWHFVDIPLGVDRKAQKSNDVSKWCEAIGPSVDGKDSPGCITTAINYEWSILIDKSKPAADRAKAVRYLSHFMGDLTQPLHDSDNHDQGGNCTRLQFFQNERLDNLHAIWDERIIARDLARDLGRDPGLRKMTQTQYAAGLDREFAKNWKTWGKAKRNADAWAWEGHEIARAITYGKLKPQIPMADPALGQTDRDGCNLDRTKVEGMHITVGDEYFAAALPVVRQQLAKAGYLLAGLLNQAF
jgi:hypothetical protein